jgi:hypothetical protein
MGATGPALVISVGPCPDFQSGLGEVVTATFAHPPSDDVLDVVFESESWPIGVTENHLFWSADRQQFVPIGEMVIGERVRTYSGETKRIEQKLPRPGPERVYNLEVYGEHVYFVGYEGLLAHNNYAGAKGSAVNKDLRKRYEAYSAWKARRGITGKPTQSQFKDFVRGNTGANGGGFYTSAAGFKRHLARVKSAFSIQDHHAIPWDNSTFRHGNHALVKAAGVDLKTHGRNIGPLGGHLGPHSSAYHRSIQRRLQTAWTRARGKGQAVAQAELDSVIAGIWRDIGNGTLKPYSNKSVYIP